MKRRTFIKQGISAGLIAGSALAASPVSAFTRGANRENEDIFIISGGDAREMFRKGIQCLGGMESLLKRGQTVVIKPNIAWNASEELAANTNPLLVAEIVKHCLSAGASKVMVFDHTCNPWKKCYKNSGIESAVEEAGGIMLPAHKEKYYREVQPGGRYLDFVKVHEAVLEADFFINVPVLKDHAGVNVSASMKNLMGSVWDRGSWHKNGLENSISEFAAWLEPDLTIIDAYRVLRKNGPRGVSVDDVEELGLQLIGRNMKAMDIQAAKCLGRDISNIKYLGISDSIQDKKSMSPQAGLRRIKI